MLGNDHVVLDDLLWKIIIIGKQLSHIYYASATQTLQDSEHVGHVEHV